jgi:hypothetical protein
VHVSAQGTSPLLVVWAASDADELESILELSTYDSEDSGRKARCVVCLLRPIARSNLVFSLDHALRTSHPLVPSKGNF